MQETRDRMTKIFKRKIVKLEADDCLNYFISKSCKTLDEPIFRKIKKNKSKNWN